VNNIGFDEVILVDGTKIAETSADLSACFLSGKYPVAGNLQRSELEMSSNKYFANFDIEHNTAVSRFLFLVVENTKAGTYNIRLAEMIKAPPAACD
jgi:hypothetical protein